MAADTVRKLTDPQGTSPVEQNPAPLISRKMLLFMLGFLFEFLAMMLSSVYPISQAMQWPGLCLGWAWD